MNRLFIIILIISFKAFSAKFNPNEAFDEASKWFHKSGKVSTNQEKLECLNKALMYDPDFVKALNNRGNLYIEMGNYKEALNDYNHTLMIDTLNTFALFNRSNMYLQNKQFNLALTDIDKLLSIDSTKAQAYALKAQILHHLGYANEALNSTVKALSLDSTDMHALEVHSYIMFEQRNFKEVLKDLNTLIKVAPDSSKWYEGKGNILSKLGKYEEAIGVCKLIIEKFPETKTVAYYNIACCYSLLNDSTNALNYLEKAFINGYNKFDHVKEDSDFTNIRHLEIFSKLLGKYNK